LGVGGISGGLFFLLKLSKKNKILIKRRKRLFLSLNYLHPLSSLLSLQKNKQVLTVL